MADIKIDENGEFVVSDNDLTIVRDNRDEIIQELNIRLGFYYTEWFLNVPKGVPYLETVLKKGTSLQTVNGIFIREINATDGVNEILEFASDFDGESRVFRLDFKVNTIYGIIENSIGVTI